MIIIEQCAGFFAFLRDAFEALPSDIKQLALFCFGGTIYIAVMRGVWR